MKNNPSSPVDLLNRHLPFLRPVPSSRAVKPLNVVLSTVSGIQLVQKHQNWLRLLSIDDFI